MIPLTRMAIPPRPLTDLTKEEFREVARKLRPDITDEEYDQMWDDFQQRKSEGRLNPQ